MGQDSMSQDAVWVFVECEGGRERSVVHELLGKGREVADALGVELHAILMGGESEEVIQRLRGHPQRILVLENPLLQRAGSDVVASILSKLVHERTPRLLLAGSGPAAVDILSRMAAKLHAALLTEVTGLEVDASGGLRVRRPVHGGRAYAELEPQCPPPYLLAVRPRSFPRVEPKGDSSLERIPVEIREEELQLQIEERLEAGQERVDLTEAPVVVSGGRGMKGPEHFALLEELARLLGGAVGASRAVVDSGWRPPQEQVGKSGNTVSPDLYLAFGISGAVHHIMGMDTSKYVVAVNNDPKALIFQYADYGVVEDLFQLLPPLIDELKRSDR